MLISTAGSISSHLIQSWRAFFRRYKYIFPAIILFLSLTIPFFGLIPYLDGDVEFLMSHNFYSGNYLAHWMAFHPPLKLILASAIFATFGFGAYSLLGILAGITGIAAVYLTAAKLSGKRAAVISSISLSLSGIYISTALFAVDDFLMTVFLLLAFAFYIRGKYSTASIMSCLAVLTKETAIFLPLSILLVEGFHRKFHWYNLLPFAALAGWIVFVHLTGHTLWNDWNFSSEAGKGSLYTIANNFISLGMLNKYAYENWLHLFIFNYNWVFWLLAILFFIRRHWTKNYSVIIIFFVLYTTAILSFQTFAVNRYTMPVFIFIYIFAASFISTNKNTMIFLPVVLFALIASLFTSSDPVSSRIWGKEQILNQNFYLKRKIDGNDGITYNMQYLYLSRDRDRIIRQGACAAYSSELTITPEVLSILRIPQCR